jgi:hypothetical protein
VQTYDDEALYNRGNRVYHNVFHANECAGIALGEDATLGRSSRLNLLVHPGLLLRQGGGDFGLAHLAL